MNAGQSSIAHRPELLAAVERMSAERYRAWPRILFDVVLWIALPPTVAERDDELVRARPGRYLRTTLSLLRGCRR